MWVRAVATAVAVWCVSGAAMAAGYAEVWNPPEATGHARARAEQQSLDGVTSDDTTGLFLNGVPPELAAAALAKSVPQSATPFEKPWPLDAWPPVPTDRKSVV